MSPFEYLTGLALLTATLGAFWLSGVQLRRRLVPGWRGAPATLAAIVLAVGMAIVTSELLGLVGLLSKAPLPIAAIAVAAGLRRQRPPGHPTGAPPAPVGDRFALILAVAAALLIAIHWVGPVLQSLDVGIYRQDSLWYHLPFAAWFAQTGSTTGILLTDPLKLTVWYYPLNSELLHSLGMVMLGNDLLSPVLNFGWMGLSLLAAWCIGRPFGLAPVTMLASAVVVDSDMMLVQAGNAPSDIVALAFLLAAIAMLVNGQAAARRGEGGEGGAIAIDRGPLAIAALAAGLAIGTKVTMLVPVAVITVGVLWRTRSESRRRAAIWIGGLLAGSGWWYLRNLLHAGNPLPWIHVGPLPSPDQEDLYPRPAHSIAEYISERHAWTDFFVPGLESTLGPLWFVVVFAVFAGIVLGLRGRAGSLGRVLALTAAAILVAHLFNPISASGPDGGPYGFASNLRYAAPGLAIGLILLPLCESPKVVRYLLTPAFAALVLAGALGSSEWAQPQPAAAIALGALLVLLALWLAGPRSPRLRAAAVLATLAALVLAGYPQQRQYFDDRYRTDVAPSLDNPGFRATRQWHLVQTWARDQHGQKIGIVGTPAAYGQYVFYGDNLSNEVRYLGEPGAYGSLTPIEGCRRWRRRIDEGRFDQVVITPEDPGSAVPSPQLLWTALGGTAQATIEASPAAVFSLSGPLNPALCANRGAAAQLGPPERFGNSHLPPSAPPIQTGVPRSQLR